MDTPTPVPVPDALTYSTADEVAECVSYGAFLTKEEGKTLYGKLWGFLSEAKSPTPLGGDGTNGTVEYPDQRQDLSNDDKAGHWWDRLLPKEQSAISQALAKDGF